MKNVLPINAPVATPVAAPVTAPASTGRAPRLLSVAVVLSTALALAACESMSERQRGTATGAGVGAAAGAVIGSATGGKAGQSAVIGGAIGAVVGNLWSKRMEDKREAVAKAAAGTGVEVVRTPNDELMVNVPADFSFDVGQAAIKPAMRPVLDQFAQGLDAQMHVRIVGHTDNTGSDAINQPLSVERAASVRDYLAGRGVAASRIEVGGRGAAEPVASNSTEAGRAQNRRVQIFLRDVGA